TNHGEVVEDTAHKVFSTPCYMLDATIIDIYNGASKVVQLMMESLK
ncbi:MAG TPA: isoprenoid biosynthesis protein ElbB, partial [Bacteroidales bacterium]|nr:isoprenoid biosynthesis protein ElbB [Bacteroidales bacterium]